jgi:hypothetical protein
MEFDIERFRKPSPLYWTLVIDGKEHTEEHFTTEHDGCEAFKSAKRKRSTYSATLWRLNSRTNECVKVEDFDRGKTFADIHDCDPT